MLFPIGTTSRRSLQHLSTNYYYASKSYGLNTNSPKQSGLNKFLLTTIFPKTNRFLILESTGSSCGGDCCCRSTHGRSTATAAATTGTAAKAADAHSDSAADASHPAGMIQGLTVHTVPDTVPNY